MKKHFPNSWQLPPKWVYRWLPFGLWIDVEDWFNINALTLRERWEIKCWQWRTHKKVSKKCRAMADQIEKKEANRLGQMRRPIIFN